MFNSFLQWCGGFAGYPELTLQKVLGWVLAPLAFATGVPWEEATTVGSLIGTKVVLNEFVAYLEMADAIKTGALLSDRAITISTFALCGFANFSSIAIQIGGISPLAPERQKDIASLGLKAVLGGVLATLLTGTLAGMIL
jgi:CNT family concentrative nucleoside transporter